MATNNRVDPVGSSPARLSLPIALGLLAAVCVAVGVYVVLCSVLHLKDIYAGFLVVWYFASVLHGDLKALPFTVAGALGGIANSAMLQAGLAGEPLLLYAALGLILLAVLLLILQRLPFVFNPSYMLFLTVLAAPPILHGADYVDVCASTLLSVVWFGGIVWVGKWLGARRRARAGTVAAA